MSDDNPLFNEVGIEKDGKPTVYKYGDWKQIAVHTDSEIKGFFGEYRWLSNFYESIVFYEGLMYISSENAYQAAKLVSSDREKLQTCSPAASKKNWKLCERMDENAAHWNARRYDVMSAILFDKFHRNQSLKELLLGTGTKCLEELNWWGDDYWGVDLKKGGQNKLGIILMATRTHLRTLEKHKI